jgi:hypothetical protein
MLNYFKRVSQKSKILTSPCWISQELNLIGFFRHNFENKYWITIGNYCIWELVYNKKMMFVCAMQTYLFQT